LLQRGTKYTKRRYEYFSSCPKECFLQITPDFWQSSISQMIIDWKCQLLGLSHEQICERFLNIGRHKLKYKEKMTALLIESNGKLIIKQMKLSLKVKSLN
jgi:hypothetical protein